MVVHQRTDSLNSDETIDDDDYDVDYHCGSAVFDDDSRRIDYYYYCYCIDDADDNSHHCLVSVLLARFDSFD